MKEEKTFEESLNELEEIATKLESGNLGLDEAIKEFEKGINSLRVTNDYSIFITGSNSKMTFIELSTDLSGRYVSFRVNPLSFKEVVELTNTPNLY